MTALTAVWRQRFLKRQTKDDSEGFACISGGAADKGLAQCLHWARKAPQGRQKSMQKRVFWDMETV